MPVPHVLTHHLYEILLVSPTWPVFQILTWYPQEIWVASPSLVRPSDTYLLSLENMGRLSIPGHYLRFLFDIHRIYGWPQQLWPIPHVPTWHPYMIWMASTLLFSPSGTYLVFIRDMICHTKPHVPIWHPYIIWLAHHSWIVPQVLNWQP